VPEYVGWTLVTEDTVVVNGPVEFHGVIVRASAIGTADAAVLDGVNALGRPYITYVAPVNRTIPFLEEEPALFLTGIFVDVGSNVAGVLVRYRPLREEDLLPGHNAPLEE